METKRTYVKPAVKAERMLTEGTLMVSIPYSGEYGGGESNAKKYDELTIVLTEEDGEGLPAAPRSVWDD